MLSAVSSRLACSRFNLHRQHAQLGNRYLLALLFLSCAFFGRVNNIVVPVNKPGTVARLGLYWIFGIDPLRSVMSASCKVVGRTLTVPGDYRNSTSRQVQRVWHVSNALPGVGPIWLHLLNRMGLCTACCDADIFPLNIFLVSTCIQAFPLQQITSCEPTQRSQCHVCTVISVAFVGE